MYKKFYAVRLFFIYLLLSAGIANAVTAQTVNLTYEDWTRGGDGTVAYMGDRMHYTITVKNTTSSNISNSTVYGAIPAGTLYAAGTTTVNGVAVSDVNGQMPFRNGGLVNSASSAAGIIAPNASVQVEYFTKVMGNTGSFSNTATLQATNSAGGLITVSSTTLPTAIQNDSWCNQIFESTSVVPAQGGTTTYPYKNIKTINSTDGTVNETYFFGASGPCFDAITATALPAGSVLTDAEAMALEPRSSSNIARLYFVNGPTNNPAQDLCYIEDYNYTTGTTAANRFTGYPLEINTGAGYEITRMTFTGDGYGYALTANALDLIQFSVPRTTNIPVITPLGALINDAGNGAANDVLAETSGDMFGDASGKLYLIPNSGKIYRINPATRIATYIGTITGMPATGTNSITIDANGYIYLSGAYQSVYRASLTNMTAVKISGGTTGIWKNGDFTSCTFPILSPALTVSKSYTDLNGGFVISGDVIEYTITVTNTGNINAGSVVLSDPIPAYAHYVANSTNVNGVAVADVSGTMPFAVSGGQLLNSAGAPAGIIMPGDANKLVIKFRVTTDPLRQVCNQATVNFANNDGSPVIYSNDPSTPAGADATCFYSDGALCEGCRSAAATDVSVKVQPNPFINDLSVQVKLNTAEQVHVRLIDFYGRTVYTGTRQLGAGYNSFQIETPANLARGVYVLELSADNNRLIQKKLIKQ